MTKKSGKNVEKSEWNLVKFAVTPFVGVWIEIIKRAAIATKLAVTPFEGVWIETNLRTRVKCDINKSLPFEECGLKSHKHWNVR